jgi:hypothetical protein
MATTAGGWPYPLGSEPVRDGDNAIKAVADTAEKRLGTRAVRAARSDLTATTGGNFRIVLTDIVVTACTITPVIPGNAVVTIVTLEGAGGGGQKSGVVFNLWVNGAVLPSGSACAVMWVAVGTPA